jgi:hypothetical protein
MGPSGSLSAAASTNKGGQAANGTRHALCSSGRATRLTANESDIKPLETKMNTRHVLHSLVRTLVLVQLLGGICIAATDDGLVGHWKLQGDCRDSSGKGNDGVNHGVELAADGARFNGIDASIEVPDSKSLALGTGDWSVAAWIHTEEKLDDVLGDILSKYDPDSRTGVNLGLMNYVGATSSQSNWRNLYVGIDAGRIDPKWTDCGRPGNSQFVAAMAVFDGHLYVGTWEPDEGQSGHVYRYEGGQKWTDCGSPDPCNGVTSMAEFGGKLYVGVSFYTGRGSARPESPNKNPGGKVYRYDGDGKWTDCGRIGDNWTVWDLAEFQGQLFASPIDSYSCPKQQAAMFRYEGGTNWAYCGDPGGRLGGYAVHNGNLYATAYSADGFVRYDGGEKWTQLGPVPETTQAYSTAIHQGHIVIGTWPNALVFRYDGPGKCTNLGRLGDEKEVMAMAVYNGKLYAGTLPLGEVYRYDGGQKWTLTGQLDTTPDVKYRRVWSMAVCQGKLFAGTLPSGKVYCLEAGKGASHDRALQPGWRHVAAVKGGEQLKLYVDGQPVAESTAFQPADYNLSNGRPLRIGNGEHDAFNGKMKDLRLYQHALGGEDVRTLAKP